MNHLVRFIFFTTVFVVYLVGSLSYWRKRESDLADALFATFAQTVVVSIFGLLTFFLWTVTK